MRTINKIVVLLFVATCMVSCERRPLDILATSLMIKHIADYSMPFANTEPTPEHYRVNMYDANNGKIVYKDFIPEGEGQVKSMPGRYVCFLCNLDDGTMVITGEPEMATFHITAPRGNKPVAELFDRCLTKAVSTSSEEGASDIPYVPMPVMASPDCFWTGWAETDIPRVAENDENFVITVRTASAVKQGYVKLEGITGSQYIVNIECFITNMVAGKNPITGELDEEKVAEHFFLQPGDNCAQGTFNYFGVVKDETPQFLYAVVTDTAGGKYLYIYNIDPYDNERGLAYEIESKIDVPEPEYEGGGGFSPELDEWDVEFINVPLGQK